MTSDDPQVGIGTVVLRAWPLLASILLLMIGGGLQGSLLGVRAEAQSFSGAVTGSILGLYYLGYVAGSAWVPGLIHSVGHIRVFAALASIASAAVVIHGVWLVPLPWMVFRFVTGVCIAGLFIVSESWLNDVSTPTTRGTMLGVYNTVVTLGLAAGSLLLNVADTNGLVLFVLGSVLLSMAAVPVALAPHDAPPPRQVVPVPIRSVLRAAPLGLVGSTVSGLTTGAVLGFGAVYATRAGFGVSGASQFLAAVLVGAIVGQVPLGRWSDRTDRRRVMAAAATLVAAGALLGILGTQADSFSVVIAAAPLLGAGGFSLYGLSFSHVADYVDAEVMPAMGGRIITVNGFGAASGPLSASIAIALVGPEGLFYVVGTVAVLYVGLIGGRMLRRAPVEEEDRATYAPVAASVTMAAVDDVVSELEGEY